MSPLSHLLEEAPLAQVREAQERPDSMLGRELSHPIAAGQATQKHWEASQFPQESVLPQLSSFLPQGEIYRGLNTESPFLEEDLTRASSMVSDLGANDVLVRFDVSQCVIIILFHRAHGV